MTVSHCGSRNLVFQIQGVISLFLTAILCANACSLPQGSLPSFSLCFTPFYSKIKKQPVTTAFGSKCFFSSFAEGYVSSHIRPARLKLHFRHNSIQTQTISKLNQVIGRNGRLTSLNKKACRYVNLFHSI